MSESKFGLTNIAMTFWAKDNSVALMLICAWASSTLEGEPEVRTIFFATGTIFSYLQSAFIPIAAFPASQAPNWKIGAKLYLGLASVTACLYVALYFAVRWDANRKATKNGVTLKERGSTTSEEKERRPVKSEEKV